MDFIPTNQPFENQYPKLVRDNIPQIIKDKTGTEPEVKILENDEEFLKYLLKKLVEEAKELEQSTEVGNTEEELADVLEIIETILKLKNWTMADIAKIQTEKRTNNGGFEKKILMLKKPQ